MTKPKSKKGAKGIKQGTTDVQRPQRISPSVVMPTPTLIPTELETVWDDDIAKAFSGLRLQQQDFLIQFLTTGNAAESYRRVYNKQATPHLASSAGGRMLSSDGIRDILDKFANRKTEALYIVTNGYREMAEATKADWVKDDNGQFENAGDSPDWQARKEAFIGLRKVYGIDSADKSEVLTKITGDVNLIVTVDTSAIKALLNGEPNQ